MIFRVFRVLAALLALAPLAAPAAPSVPTAAAPRLEVQIEGVADALLQNVRALLTIEAQKAASDLDAYRIRRYHRRAPREISQALEPFGYYQATIDSSLKQDAGQWLARYRIDPGPQLVWRSVEVVIQGEGQSDEALGKVVAELPIRTGGPVVHAEYEASKKTLLQQALARGYLDARLSTHRLVIHSGLKEASAQLLLESGIRYELGEVSFDGTDLKPRLLEAYITFPPGTPYSHTHLLKLQRALENSDYFSSVEVVPDRANAEGKRIPVQVVLTPRKANKYTVGLGFGTDTGPRARIGWANRRINKLGHHLSTEYRISSIKSSLNASYVIPLRKARTDYLEFDASLGRENTDTADTRFRILGMKHSSLWHRWRRTLALTQHQEDFSVGLDNADTRFLIPSIGLARSWPPDQLIVERGFRVQAELRGAADALLSDATFIQARVDAKAIFSFWKDGRILLRGSYGTTHTNRFEKLPPSLRFFAGGDQSVRGYAFESIGPTDESGEVIGGRHLLVGSVEYEHRLTDTWRVAVFRDAGDAGSLLHADLKHGAGVGLRWQSPIGMVRFDLASAISEEGKPLRLHLTVGPDL